MAFDTYLNLDGIQGESQDSTFKGWIEIFSFSMGASNPATIGSATGGAGAGKVTMSDISLQKLSDAASPLLFQACCSGKHFPKASMILRKAGGKQMVYLQYDLTEVFVESIQWSGSTGGDDSPTEAVSLAFGQVSVTYTPQKVDGTPDSAVIAGWDVKANTKM